MQNIEKITLRAPASMPNKVSAIKAIRNLTGLGLKEAKDASETTREQTFELSTYHMTRNGVTDVQREIDENIRLLRNEGFEIGDPIYKVLDQLRELAAQALRQGEDEIANEMLQMVLAEKLRRGNPVFKT